MLVAAAVFAPGPIGRVRNHIVRSAEMDIDAPTGGQPLDLASGSVPPAVRLAAVGDIGTGDREEQETADAMSAIPGHFDGLVLLGDNVYPSGDPARLPATVFTPFHDVLDDGTDLLAALGNHDVMHGNGDRQVAALGMPGHWYAWHHGPVLLIVLDSNQPDNPDQLAWLQKTLAAATEPWRIVAMHHPPYSAGYHGSSEAARDAFGPLFERFGVELVLAGHDHDYQRSKPIHGITYIVSGGGATTRPTSRASFTADSWSTQHFLDIDVWCNHLEVQAVGQDGLVYDTTTLDNPTGRTASACKLDGLTSPT